MERDYGAEIDQIRQELQQMRAWLMRDHLPPVKPHAPKEGPAVLDAAGNEQLNAVLSQLLTYTQDQNAAGAVAYTGTFCSGDSETTKQSMWASAVPGNELLALNDQHLIEKVLASVGNSQRLGILLALLQKPMTVNQLIEAVGANTTGQIYHHLKPLIAADIIQEEKSVYAVIPHRVQGIVMLLCGVRDLIDTRYTSGKWEG